MFIKIAFAIIGAALIVCLVEKISNALSSYKDKSARKIDQQE